MSKTNRIVVPALLNAFDRSTPYGVDARFDTDYPFLKAAAA